MNLAEVKAVLGYSQLNLDISNDKDGNPTKWLRHWDNDNRIAVSIHEDTFKAIKANPEISTLGVQVEEAEGDKGAYTRKRIVKYTDPQFVL